MIKIISPENNSKICILTPKQKSFLLHDRSGMAVEDFDYLNLKKHAHPDFSLGAGVVFKWEPVCEATLEISESRDFDTSLSYSGCGNVEVFNLKPNTVYFAKITGEEELISFETEDTYPRYLNIDGATNVRDLGGARTNDGRRVKMGLIYRGSELNSHMNVTEKGLWSMENELKIKSVLDLRGKAELLENTYNKAYIHISNSAYATYLEEIEINKRIFDFLSDEKNYPIYFHCWGGADRTGTVAYILGLILGVRYEDLIDDYESTTLSIWGIRTRNRDLYQNFITKLETFEGETLYEKTVSFMLSSGITMEQIENIRSFMLEK